MTLASLIPVGAWLWDKYGKSVTDKTGSVIRSQWDKFLWNEAAERYRLKVKKLYGTMQIMGMTEPVPLDDLFTDAYMLDKPTAFGRFDIERLKRISSDLDATPPDAQRINGLRLVVEKGNLFILGKPGAGKTTFLKYIALKAAEQIIDKVPIFISLKHWADSGLELMPFVADRFDICGFPAAQPFVEELLKSGSAIVLFDALDEVNQESGQRDKETRAISDFVEKYDRTQCLVTCRIAASDYSFQPFTYVEIADFTEKQIQIFVGNWFRDEEGERDEETCKKFLTDFARDDNKGLRDLARTPLLLTLLCLAFNETLTFPQRRVEIYEEALDALLKKWDSSRRIRRDEVYRKLSLGHKENLLARIAAETFEKNEYFIQQSELERLITDYIKNVPPHDTNETTDGEVILNAIEAQHGIFVERAREVYSFSHLTFQEYFTAKYIVANGAKGALANLAKEHCADKRWREVFLLTSSVLPDASPFMAILRHEVDELFQDDETLRTLLNWADKRADSIDVAPWIMREYRLFLELYCYTPPTFDIDYNLALRHDPILTRNPAFERGLTLDMNLGIALVVARDFRRKDGSFDTAFTKAHGLGLDELERELKSLAIPPNDQALPEWQEFTDKLQDLMVRHRDIAHKWDFPEESKVRLADFLYATVLMRSCLELAFMPPDEKKAMLNSLYLPPPGTAKPRR